jgi:hypothetical protein
LSNRSTFIRLLKKRRRRRRRGIIDGSCKLQYIMYRNVRVHSSILLGYFYTDMSIRFFYKKNYSLISFFFIFIKKIYTRCHVSIERHQNDTRRSYKISRTKYIRIVCIFDLGWISKMSFYFWHQICQFTRFVCRAA